MANTAYAATTVTGISVQAQNGTVNFGASGSATFRINLTKGNGNGNGSDAISLTWANGTPANVINSVTVSFNPGATYNPNGITFVTLTLTTTAATPVGNYNFTIKNVDANGGTSTDNNNNQFSVSVAPPNIAYSTPNSYAIGANVTLSPTNTGGTPTGYTLPNNPALPNGLNFSRTTGIISGTPTTVTTAKTYTVTASNGSGNDQSTFTIAITPPPAPIITYTGSPYTFTVGDVVNISPTNTGGAATSYIISNGALPAGLTFSTATGTITGTATAASGGRTFTISGKNAGGTGPLTSFSITVVNPPIPVISYTTPNTFTVGTPIATLSPTNTGGTPTSYTAVNGLPDGLAMDNNGNITGTPTTANLTPTVYNIRASNAGGNSANFQITITVNPQKPNISYTTVTLNVGITASLSPKNTGGDGTYTLAVGSPALPAWLTLDPATGILSGTPTATSPQVTYSITATNISGSSTNTIKITVNPYGTATYDWSGANSTAWTDPGNWNINGTPQTSVYPGSSSNTDIANVGVNTDILTFANNPMISTGNITIASLTFGNNNAATNNNNGGIMSLTVNSFTLTVSGTILQMHSQTGGNNFLAVTPGVTTTFQGNGTINCAALKIGDTNTPENITSCVTTLKIGGTTTSTLIVNVTGDLTINSASDGFGINFENSDAKVSFSAGTLNIGGTLRLTNTTPGGHIIPAFTPYAAFSLDLNNVNTPILNLAGATAINIGTSTNAANKLDFYNTTVKPHKAGTVNYIGTTANQEIYNFGTTAGQNTLIDNVGETPGDGYVYQNIGFSGSGSKNLDADATNGVFKVGGNFTTTTTATEIINLTASNPALTVAGDFSNGANVTLANGTGAIFFGGNFANAGTCNFGVPLVSFNSIDAATLTGPAAVTFTNVAFTSGGAKTITGGTFNIATNGIIKMSGNTTLNAGSAFLTLLSDATGSAAVDVIPAGCKITGQVNVQRYLSATRAFRLLSSPVNSGTTAATGNYSLNYVGSSVYLTGTTGTAGGFDVTSGPTLYLYKENFPGDQTAFTNNNFRDVTDIRSGTATPPVYSIDGETGTRNIPVGMAFLMYDRGDKHKFSLAQETTAGFQGSEVTLNATGYLNQGPVTFTDLYDGYAATLSCSNPSTDPARKGANSIGNPYACTIDLETLGTGPTGGPSGTGIVATGPGIQTAIYEYNMTTNNFDPYLVGAGLPQLDHETRYISSGEGFLAIANGPGVALTINESAKVSTAQNTGPNLLMSKSSALAAQPANLQYLHLEMTKDSANKSGAIIAFKSNTKAAFNPSEDALYRAGNGSVFFSSLSADNKQLVINQQPLSQKSLTIRLYVSGIGGTPYTLNMKDMKGIPSEYDVWLMDANKKDSVDMRKNPSYAFTTSAADTGSWGAYRFSIVVRQNPALAYKLLSFTAGKENNNYNNRNSKDAVQVNWTTQNEQNYTRFTVERSTDGGRRFDVIGSVNSTGAGEYSLLDKDPNTGNNLYRLKQVDLNDSTSYSKVVTVKYNGNGMANNDINIYPNPARNNVSIDITAKQNDNARYDIRISNNFGLVVRETFSAQSTWQTNVGYFMPGTYMVQVVNHRDQSLVGRVKFVKL